MRWLWVRVPPPAPDIKQNFTQCEILLFYYAGEFITLKTHRIPTSILISLVLCSIFCGCLNTAEDVPQQQASVTSTITKISHTSESKFNSEPIIKPSTSVTENLSSTSITSSFYPETSLETEKITGIAPEPIEPIIDYLKTFIYIAEQEIDTKEAGENNIKYNTWYYGKPVQDKSDKNVKYAWCAVFIAWCAHQAGISPQVIPKTASASYYATYYQELKQYTKYNSTYAPKVGDFIFFDWEKTRGSISTIDHVGIVIAVKGDEILTIEGNYSDKVSCNKYNLNDRLITGYATPEYKNS